MQCDEEDQHLGQKSEVTVTVFFYFFLGVGGGMVVGK